MSEDNKNLFNIPLIANRIREAKKMFEVAPPKKNPNTIELAPSDRPLKHKMQPDELQDAMKANRGTGYHKLEKDKRTKNPRKNSDGWD